jgi:hypothetical protein
MSLPRTNDEAALRALDRKCAVADSVVSKRTVRQLAAGSLDYKGTFLNNSCVWGLGNLVRCALEAGVSPDTTADEETGSTPVLVVAAQRGAVPALNALLAVGVNIELADRNGALPSYGPPSRATCRVCSSFSTLGRTQTRKTGWETQR